MAFNKPKALQEAEKLIAHGKVSLAIRQYEEIAQNDPSDLNLLNTIGDLYVRERSVPKALEQFRKLANAYVREGFTVKAIAMYKKITKLDAGAVEPVLKLAELYQLQGLAREAREQYAQAVDFYRKNRQSDKAAEVLRAVIRLDPENTSFRLHLAEFCEGAGLKADAMQTYLEAAEIALRRGDLAAAELPMRKAVVLDAKNSRVHILEARLALAKKQPAKAEKILESNRELKSAPEGRRLLLEAYLAGENLPAAQKLINDVYRANPADFSPLASFAELCFEKGDYEAALKPLIAAADELIANGNTSGLMQWLRKIWEKRPQDTALLELIYRVCTDAQDQVALPEIIEALGHAYVQAGELEKAEAAYRKLTELEPQNEAHRGLLKQVLQRLGRDVVAAAPDLSNLEMAPNEPSALASEILASETPEVDPEVAALVKEAIENSDLYFRYGSVEKAAAELDKVLVNYPDQIEVHKRLVEICQRKLPARAAQSASVLARIYSERGDKGKTKRYENLVRQCGGVRETAAQPPAPAPSSMQAPAQTGASDSGPPVVAPAAEPAYPQTATNPVPSDTAVVAPPAVPSGPAPSSLSAPTEATEIDLSSEWESAAVPPGRPQGKPKDLPFDSEETRVEIKFYLDNGFFEEAQKAVRALEEKFPGSAQVAGLRELVDESVAAEATKARESAAEPSPPTVTPSPAKVALPAPSASRPQILKEEPIPAQVAPPAPLEPAILNDFPVPSRTRPAPSARRVQAAVDPQPPPTPLPSADILGDLANELAAALEGIEATAPPAAPLSSPPAPSVAAPRSSSRKAVRIIGETDSPLSGLLEELREIPGEQAQDDPETHYSLGVAFREMGLLDEAIGEFQKVVRGTPKGAYPPNFLQACTLLAICFMDKKMPAIAVKWYSRALEAPGLDERAILSLHYDLGVAYEESGDARTALEKFTEVYSQNIDYRDVAEKIRALQQKAT